MGLLSHGWFCRWWEFNPFSLLYTPSCPSAFHCKMMHQMPSFDFGFPSFQIHVPNTFLLANPCLCYSTIEAQTDRQRRAVRTGHLWTCSAVPCALFWCSLLCFLLGGIWRRCLFLNSCGESVLSQNLQVLLPPEHLYFFPHPLSPGFSLLFRGLLVVQSTSPAQKHLHSSGHSGHFVHSQCHARILTVSF